MGGHPFEVFGGDGLLLLELAGCVHLEMDALDLLADVGRIHIKEADYVVKVLVL